MNVTPTLVGQLSLSEERPVYLCALRNGRYIRLSQSAYDLYRGVAGGATFDELAEIARRTDPRVSPADVEAAYQRIAAKIAVAERQASPRHRGFWLTFRLMPARLVAPVGRVLARAFEPLVAALLVAAIAVAAWSAASDGLVTAAVEPEHFAGGYLLFIASLFAHELGHAAACVRFGAAPGAIGMTMYLIYPALYTDVSAAWALRRRERVVVDLGGVYFHLIVAAIFVAAHAASGWEPLRVAVLMILGACAMSLNPILKFDGYWVVADTLGVTNLAAVPARIGAVLWARLRGRPARALPWRAPIIVILAAYGVVAVVFWAYFLWLLVGLAADSLGAYPSLVDRVVTSISGGGLGVATFELLSATLVLVFAGLLLQRPVIAVLRFAASLLRPRQP